MIKVGIDTLAVYTSRYALDLGVLAEKRGIDADKFYVGLGQRMMSVPPPGEDIVTMAANAAVQALADVDVNTIDLLLFATESAFDQSKATGLYVHELLGLPSRCRTVELKQACYSGTAAIQMAMPYLRENPDRKVLVIASDIARYGLETTGESSQGCGAVAMVLSTNPRILAFEHDSGYVSESVMDFWRPNYLDAALVDGKYSSRLYLFMLEKTWKEYKTLSERKYEDHAFFCYHAPVPRLVEKAHKSLLKWNEQRIAEDVWMRDIDYSLDYSRKIGNSYSASLFIGLASLLDNAPDDLAHKRVGFYSYGSGCVAEYFSGVVQEGYQNVLKTKYHEKMLKTRKEVEYDEYEAFYEFEYAKDGTEQEVPKYDVGLFRLAEIANHKRVYDVVEAPQLSVIENEEDGRVKVSMEALTQEQATTVS